MYIYYSRCYKNKKTVAIQCSEGGGTRAKLPLGVDEQSEERLDTPQIIKNENNTNSRTKNILRFI